MKIKSVKSEVEALHQMNSNGYFLKNNLSDGGIGLVHGKVARRFKEHVFIWMSNSFSL